MVPRETLGQWVWSSLSVLLDLSSPIMKHLGGRLLFFDISF